VSLLLAVAPARVALALAFRSMSRVNRAYRRLFRQLLDPSEIGSFATIDVDHVYSGDFGVVHGRTAGVVGGTAGAIVGGALGFGLSVAIIAAGTVPTCGTSLAVTPLAVVPVYVVLAVVVVVVRLTSSRSRQLTLIRAAAACFLALDLEAERASPTSAAWSEAQWHMLRRSPWSAVSLSLPYAPIHTLTHRQRDLRHRDTQCQSDDADAAAAALRQYLPARATEMSLQQAGKIAHKMHLKKEQRIEFEALLQHERDDLCTSVCA